MCIKITKKLRTFFYKIFHKLILFIYKLWINSINSVKKYKYLILVEKTKKIKT